MADRKERDALIDNEMTAVGAFHTHWCCPSCFEENDPEGDVRGEVCECTACGEQALVT